MSLPPEWIEVATAAHAKCALLDDHRRMGAALAAALPLVVGDLLNEIDDSASEMYHAAMTAIIRDWASARGLAGARDGAGSEGE